MGWAQEEFNNLELGDARRTQRLIKWVDDLSAQPTGSIPLACGGWAETKPPTDYWTTRWWTGEKFWTSTRNRR
ncbi:MAG: transposase [Candidatus Competibacteraceae bacterium]|nr:transposase [Candidatus Competibacteraceae bacterium]MCB1821484.1 transposase [Candidatus Competibacteraceae bacterium]